jgi:hypothetical protein
VLGARSMKRVRAQRAAWTSALLGAALSMASLGCGGPSAPASGSESARFPAWEGRARAIYDDNIDPAAVGLTMEAPSPRTDPFLRERTQTAELVARVRVTTVTVDTFGADVSYHLGLQVAAPPFSEPKLPDLGLELYIRPKGRAYAIVKAFDARLRGSSFIGFFHRFDSEGGEPEIHWHLSPDSAEVAAAVREALALAELMGS